MDKYLILQKDLMINRVEIKFPLSERDDRFQIKPLIMVSLRFGE